MLVRISLFVLRICVVLAVILGILFWLNIINPDTNSTILSVHQTLGLLTVLTLWIIGVMTLLRGHVAIGVVALVWGALVLYVGLNQESMLPGSSHWLVQVLHLILGLGAIGLGETAARRYRRKRA
jgi:hypothetical protein